VTTLASVVVFVVGAFLVETAAAHRKFTVPRLGARTMDSGILDVKARRLIQLSSVRHVRFTLEDA
jgi:hypothetical protein